MGSGRGSHRIAHVDNVRRPTRGCRNGRAEFGFGDRLALGVELKAGKETLCDATNVCVIED